jgi:hypothetical protein
MPNTKYRALPFTGSNEGKRFNVIVADDAAAITKAKEEASKLEFTHVFVETDKGRLVYEGPVKA